MNHLQTSRKTSAHTGEGTDDGYQGQKDRIKSRAPTHQKDNENIRSDHGHERASGGRTGGSTRFSTNGAGSDNTQYCKNLEEQYHHLYTSTEESNPYFPC